MYEVNHSIVDSGHADHGRRRLRPEEVGFYPAPLVLGLVIAPIFEMSLRQSLIMSDGNWMIFLQRPVALVLMAVSGALLALSAFAYVSRRKDWRAKLVQNENSGSGS